MLTMSFPKVHIAIAGIEKIIPKLEDLDLFWSTFGQITEQVSQLQFITQ